MKEPSAMENSDKTTNFTLNGLPVTARNSETVLDVANRCGVRIPALCHHDAVSPYGACRLCLVEVSWGKRSKLVTSCIYQPCENDSVNTDSDRVRRARRMVIEMLLARCPDVPVIRDIAREYGVEKNRFPPTPVLGPKGCILCGLCVRVCDEVVGQHAIGFASRGIERYITTPFGEPSEECIGCGACVHICPTNALHYEDAAGVRTMKEFNTSIPLVKCAVCGRHFATTRQVEYVLQKCKVPEEVAKTCPRCRGAEFGNALADVVTSRRSAAKENKESEPGR